MYCRRSELTIPDFVALKSKRARDAFSQFRGVGRI